MLLLKKTAGEWRPRWYGRWKMDGKIQEVPLCRWKGTPPASGKIGKDAGDRVFEASRNRALAELREIAEGKKSEADQAALAERVHRARYGRKVKRIKIADLYAVWRDRPRKHPPTEGHEAVARRTFERFEDYMSRTAPRTTETGALRAEHVRGFLAEIEAEGVSSRTWNGILSIMRGTLQRADPYCDGTRFLKDQPAKDEATIHRTPFSEEELERVFEAAAQRDPLMHGLIVAAACTAMRRGDVCRLRWSSVDMAAGFVVVKTAKTGESVEIPIFPPLRAVLESRPRRGAFVFPEAEKLYRTAPDALNRRLQAVLADAGFVRQPRHRQDAEAYPEADKDKIMAAAEAAAESAGWSEKRRTKARDILTRHLRGEAGREIAEALEISPGAVSTYLHDLEEMTRLAIVTPPAKPEPEPSACTLGTISPDMPRLKRPSLKGWHSFRTTWTTMALSAGVPIEIVRRVTGHRTAEIVMENYFRPGRAQFRQVLAANMPKALVGRSEPAAALAISPSRLQRRLEGMTAKNWRRVRDEILKEAKA